MDTNILAWVAGMFDGEGSLTLKRAVRHGHTHHRIWITIGMANKPDNEKALVLMQKLFGGYIGIHKNSDNRNDSIHWTIASQMAYECLKKVSPFLIIKKKHAQLLIEFQEICVSRKGKKNNLAKFERQAQYFEELRKLNTRGRITLAETK
jgi:hypothetical protein